MQNILVEWNLLRHVQSWFPVFPTYTITGSDPTLFLFPPSSTIRKGCIQVLNNKFFYLAWYVCIFTSTCFTFFIEPYNHYRRSTLYALLCTQAVLVCLFWAKVAMEMVALGAVLHKGSYFRSFWRSLEFLLNVVSIIQLLPPTYHVLWLRAFAALRPVHPLLFVPGFKPLCVPLVHSCAYIFDVFVTFLLVIGCLGAVGVMTIGPRINQRCYFTDSSSSSEPSTPLLMWHTPKCGEGYQCPSYADDNDNVEGSVACRALTTIYSEQQLNYENIYNTFLVIVKVAATDNWEDQLEDSMNIIGKPAALYMSVIIIFSFLLYAYLQAIVAKAYAVYYGHSSTDASMNRGYCIGEEKVKDVAVQTVPVVMQVTPNIVNLNSLDTREMSGSSNPFIVNDSVPPSTTPQTRRRTELLPSAKEGEALGGSASTPKSCWLWASSSTSWLWKALASLEGVDMPSDTASPSLEDSTTWTYFVVQSMQSPVLLSAIIVLTVVSVLLQCVFDMDMAHDTKATLSNASAATSIVFVIPLVAKVVMFGIRVTAQDPWNYLDVIGPLTGIVELATPATFRHVRGLRVLRIARAFRYLMPLYLNRGQATSLLYLALFLFLIVALYAVAGRQLFADPSRPIRGPPVAFATPWTALRSSFSILIGDSWSSRLLFLLSIFPAYKRVSVTLFVLTLLFIGYYVVGSLVVAILSTSFTTNFGRREAALAAASPLVNLLPPPLRLNPVVDRETLKPQHTFDTHPLLQSIDVRPLHRPVSIVAHHDLDSRLLGSFLCSLAEKVGYLLANPIYMAVSFFCIVLSVVALFFDVYHADHSTSTQLHQFHVFYTVFFMTEMLMKIFATGIFHQEIINMKTHRVTVVPGYFARPFNYIDMASNMMAFVALFYPTVRVGTIIRTARLFRYSQAMRRASFLLLCSLARVLTVLPLIISLYVFVAILGMQMFAGGLERCPDGSECRYRTCYATDVRAPFKAATTFSYDNLGQSLLSVLILSTTSSWTIVMQGGMPRVENSHAGFPQANSALHSSFCIFAILILRVFAIRTATAAAVAYLSRRKGATLFGHTTAEGVSVECVNDVEHVTGAKALTEPLPNAFSQWLHYHVVAYRLSFKGTYYHDTPVLSTCVLLFTIVHAGFVAAAAGSETEGFYNTSTIIDCIAVGVYGSEIVVRVCAYGVRHLATLHHVWDVVVLVCLIISLASPSPTLYFFRAIVFTKVIVMLSLGMTVRWSIDDFAPIVCVALMYAFILFTYSFIGVQLFGGVTNDGIGITNNRNFSRVMRAILVMFTCSTSSQWCFVLDSCRRERGVGALIFFVSYLIIINLIVIQLMTAVVITWFRAFAGHNHMQAFRVFYQRWTSSFGNACVRVNLRSLVDIIPTLPSAIVNKMHPNSAMATMTLLASSQLHVDKAHTVAYRDVVHALARKVPLLPKKKCPLRTLYLPTADLVAAEVYSGYMCERRFRDVLRPSAVDYGDLKGMLDCVVTEDCLLDARSIPDRFSSSDSFLPAGATALPHTSIFLFPLSDTGSKQSDM